MIEIIFAGFGGQGILTTGIIVAEYAVSLDKHVTWYPSYGSEMRGGTANCTVKIDDKEIASPYAKELDILFAMNEPSIDKFEKQIKSGGIMVVNSSIVKDDRTFRDDITVVKADATDIAARAENPRGANIALMGAMASASDKFDEDDLEQFIDIYFGRKGKVNPKNRTCYRMGIDEAEKITSKG